MTTAKLATCHVLADPASPAPMAGYVVACSVFYVQGFCVPRIDSSARCVLELHHLTPSGILHTMAFVTLCKVYRGIEPHFNMWKYFFLVRLWLDSNAKAMV
jgi:hypothetical protein